MDRTEILKGNMLSVPEREAYPNTDDTHALALVYDQLISGDESNIEQLWADNERTLKLSHARLLEHRWFAHVLQAAGLAECAECGESIPDPRDHRSNAIQFEIFCGACTVEMFTHCCTKCNAIVHNGAGEFCMRCKPAHSYQEWCSCERCSTTDAIYKEHNVTRQTPSGDGISVYFHRVTCCACETCDTVRMAASFHPVHDGVTCDDCYAHADTPEERMTHICEE